MNKISLFVLPITILIAFSCTQTGQSNEIINSERALSKTTGTSLIILGTVQDAGSPHVACKKICCKDLFLNPDKNRQVVSLGLVDSENPKNYLFEATPNMTTQMKTLKEFSSLSKKETPDGIFLTHAHVGHYTGLMYLGKEAMNSKNISVYAMPKMSNFLKTNGPWSQLVINNNISIHSINNQEKIALTSNIEIIPFVVPHRDEYSETVGYTITGPNKNVLFIPDIDKWQKWNTSITDAISKVDYAFIDGTFYDAEEINNRDVSEIPHPFIIESMALFEGLSKEEKAKIYFIHFNHTNPALDLKSIQSRKIINNGFNIAKINDVFKL